MEFVPLRARIFLFGIIFLLMIFFILISCRTNGNNTVYTVDNMETIAPTPTSEPRNMIVRTVNASVYGVEETILADKEGRPLYYFKKDAWHKVSCTGDCTDAWIPLVFNEKGPVIASTKLPGKLTVDKTVNGNQVAYNGHYLYTFFGDSMPDNIQGQGRDDQWYVATPHLR
jgi:predicted lipoprotein with Yx(FWY)xxD motif